MPLHSYGVLKGRATAKRASTEGHPHYQVRITANGRDYRAAINVRSMLSPSAVEYLVQFDFQHPLTKGLEKLPLGFHPLESAPDGLALDFIRLNLFDCDQFLILPCDGPGCRASLNEVLDEVICGAIADPDCRIYVYGEPWEAPNASDGIFRFSPSRGMHEVHMNQGNDPSHWEQDGVWQDGALLVEHPRQGRWIGVFLKFQSQSWHTDDATGHPLTPPKSHDPASLIPLDRRGMPHPDGMVRIVAATVHPFPRPPARQPAPESVTLLNVCPFPVDLTGWSLANRSKRRWRLRETLAPGEAREFPLGPSLPLGGDGGIITLLEKEGLKVHGVSYTGDQARDQGWRMAFHPGKPPKTAKGLPEQSPEM